MAENKSIGGPEELNSGYTNRIVVGGGVAGAFTIVVGWIQRGREQKSNIVTGVRLHNLTSTHRPI